MYLLQKAPGTLGAGNDVRRYERHWTPVHFDVEVDDIDQSVSRAIKAGARVEREPQPTPYGRIAMLADPFGHGFCLIEFNAEGYDHLLDAADGRLLE